MRILVANKFAYVRGGLERIMFQEIDWLAAAGNSVALFSTSHPSNAPSEWSSYFAPYLELGAASDLAATQRLVAAARFFHNRHAAKKLSELIDAFDPDVIHIHGIHRQLSPSILAPAIQRKIPVVQTLHDYHHVCPADVLLHSGREICSPRRCGRICYTAAVRGRCVRGSVVASALSAAETGFSRLTRAYERGVRRFISPSAFLAAKMAEGGWTLPVDVVPNAVQTQSGDRGGGSGFVVIGRLAPEKGIRVALEAARLADVDLTVIGEGPLRAELQSEFPDARFLGYLDQPAIQRTLEAARAVVVPSMWYENAPMSVLEAMAAGTPVVASDIGGIPEQVTDGVTGILVAPGDVKLLAAALRTLDGDEALARRLGAAARLDVARRFSPEAHCAGLVSSYRLAGVQV